MREPLLQKGTESHEPLLQRGRESQSQSHTRAISESSQSHTRVISESYQSHTRVISESRDSDIAICANAIAIHTDAIATNSDAIAVNSDAISRSSDTAASSAAQGPSSVAFQQSPRGSHTPTRFGKQEILEGVDTCEVPAHLQSDFQTVMNTVNLYVGAGLLSMPYAMKIGGWIGIVVLGLCTALSCTTGHFISYACDALPLGVPPSYPALGRAAFGPSGGWILLGAVMLEFWGALSMCLIIVWRSLSIAFARSSICLFNAAICIPIRGVVVGLTLLVALPIILIRTFSRLSSVAMSGVISSLILCTVVFCAWALDPSAALIPDHSAHSHTLVDWPHLPIAAGIFIVSLSGHAGLPSLRRGMQHPSHFPSCLRATFVCIFLLYASMAFFGYLYFGESAEVLVTANLDAAGSLAGITLFSWGSFSMSLSQALSLLVAVSVFTTVPPLVYVLGEIITDFMIGAVPDRASNASTTLEGGSQRGLISVGQREGWETFFRIFVLSVGFIMALSCYNYLARLESLVGGVLSMTASLLLPTLVVHSLYMDRLSFPKLIVLRSFIVLVLMIPVGIVYCNLTQ